MYSGYLDNAVILSCHDLYYYPQVDHSKKLSNSPSLLTRALSRTNFIVFHQISTNQSIGRSCYQPTFLRSFHFFPLSIPLYLQSTGNGLFLSKSFTIHHPSHRGLLVSKVEYSASNSINCHRRSLNHNLTSIWKEYSISSFII